jgi:dTDP-4-amino-4,6-dideoxygalactose transaminase
LYVIRAHDRDALMTHLRDRQIFTALHYPVPVHVQKAYAHLGYREGDFPVTERVCKEIVSLPMFPDLTAEQIERVAEGIHDFAVTPA